MRRITHRIMLALLTFFVVSFTVCNSEEFVEIIAVPDQILISPGKDVLVTIQIKNISKKFIQVPLGTVDESGVIAPFVYSLRIDKYSKKSIWEIPTFYRADVGSHTEANFRTLDPDQIVTYKIKFAPFMINDIGANVSDCIARLNLYLDHQDQEICVNFRLIDAPRNE